MIKKITFMLLAITGLTATTNAQNKYLLIDNPVNLTGNRYKIIDNANIRCSAAESKTITFRLKSAVGTNVTFAKILNKNPATAAVGQAQYGVNVGSGLTVGSGLRFNSVDNSTGVNTGNTSANAAGTVTYNDGNWHHFALVLNDTDGKSRLYLDGVVLTTTSATGPFNYNSTSATDLIIGGQATSGNGNFSIDDLRIWNSAFTNTQVITDATSIVNGPTAGLLTCYDFQSGTNTSIPDVSGIAGNTPLVPGGSVTNSTGIVTGDAIPTLSNKDNVIAQGFSVYPNPANSVININQTDNSIDIKNVSLVNILGQSVYSSASTKAIDVSNFAKGLHILKIESKDGSTVITKVEVN